MSTLAPEAADVGKIQLAGGPKIRYDYTLPFDNIYLLSAWYPRKFSILFI